MIRTTNVKSGFVYLDEVRHVTLTTFEKWTRRSKPQFGDVILSREAPVGEVGRFTSDDDKVFLGQRLFHYRPNPRLLDWNYLAYILQSHEIQGRLRGMSFGATVEHIKVGDAEDLAIPCPPIEIQSKIGSILSSYDDLIENNRHRMKLLEDAARLLYEEWFVRLRFPGREHSEIKNGVPKGWKRVKLGEHVILHYGKALKAEERVDGPFPVYGSSGIVGKHEKALVKGPAIILGRKGNVGSVFWSARDFHPIDTVYFINASSSSLYLYYALRNMHFLSTDVAVPGLNRDFAYSRELLLPPQVILDAFLELVTPIREQIEKLDMFNKKLREARDLLLPRLMSGEIAV
jgi:type I restriction enzyme S subunit